MRIGNAIIFFIFVAMICFSCQSNIADKIVDPCKGQKNIVFVDINNHQLYICQDNHKIKAFRVFFGRGGLYKKAQGDNKTPVGEYSLGTPRSSNRFGIFIPIGFPTQEQLSKGFSGGDIGLHGPSRPSKQSGYLNTSSDWTQGCIAVGTDKEISEIAQWVKEKNVNRIVVN
jgi:murein L,D-transpeptidase YafK